MNSKEITQYAKELKSNPLLIEIFKDVDEGVREGFRQADLADTKELQALAALIQAVSSIEDRIGEAIDAEKVEVFNNRETTGD